MIDEGEKAKSFDSTISIINEMADKRFDRSSLVLAITLAQSKATLPLPIITALLVAKLGFKYSCSKLPF